MGNKLSRRRHVVDERYTKPQGLYQHRDIDHKKLRKLILDAKLAPCYPGGEESTVDLDECPICFLYYPSLNRSRCCMKGICTECFLQMKSPHSARPTQCPFCKTSNYAVEYRGVKTQEEKGIEQAEEQKVIEAKIRMRQQELQAEEERMQKRRDIVNRSPIPSSADVQGQGLSNLNVMSDGEANVAAFSLSSRTSTSQPNGVLAAHGSSGVAGTRSHPFHGRHNRDDDFDLDLEDIMVMEAIWLSIQDHGSHRLPASSPASFDNVLSPRPGYDRPVQPSVLEDNHESNISARTLAESREMIPSSSVTGGLACAIAALAERQVLNVDNTIARQSHQNCLIDAVPSEISGIEGQEISRHNTAVIEELSSSVTYERAHGDIETEDQEPAYPDESKSNTELEGERGSEVHAPESWIEVSLESGRALSACPREGSRGSMSDWMLDHSSEVVEVGTSFSSSVPSASDLPWEAPDVSQNAEISVEPVSFGVQPSVVPESFEEQMMLAMAISLVEAQARS